MKTIRYNQLEEFRVKQLLLLRKFRLSPIHFHSRAVIHNHISVADIQVRQEKC